MAGCYMCDQNATSVEHAPPQCLFPEQKDLPPGVDLRKQLITVPSCDAHNSKKSHDDEYLLYTLVLNLTNNSVARDHFLTKIMRGIQKNPGVIAQLTKNVVPVTALDNLTGQIAQTAAMKVDMSRIKTTLDHMGRALFFHHCKRRWNGKIKAIPHFLLSLESERENDFVWMLDQKIRARMQNEPRFGANPQVFFYQVLEGIEDFELIMPISIYEGARITLLFRA